MSGRTDRLERILRAAQADHRDTCEATGPKPQAPYERCPHRATHLERAARAAG